MTTLREKIEQLPTTLFGGGRFISLDEALRIVAEHERELIADLRKRSADVNDGTADSVFAGQSQGLSLAAAVIEYSSRPTPPPTPGGVQADGMEGARCGAWRVRENGPCRNPAPCATHPRAEVVPLWRTEMEWLAGTIGMVPDPLSMADHRRLAALIDLDNLRQVIESGKGEAAVPEGVMRALDHAEQPTGWTLFHDPAGRAHVKKPGYMGWFFAKYLLIDAVNAYGNSLVEVESSRKPSAGAGSERGGQHVD